MLHRERAAHASSSSPLPVYTYTFVHYRADDWEVLTVYLDAFMHMNEDLRASDLSCVPFRPQPVLIRFGLTQRNGLVPLQQRTQDARRPVPRIELSAQFG